MSKKKEKQYFITELDDESDENKVLSKHFIAKSKDGLIVGESKTKGDHYTILPENEDISFHKTEVKSNGSKKYPSMGSFLDFINSFKNIMKTCKTTSEIVESISPNSYILGATYEDFENKEIVKKDDNIARLNIINLLLSVITKANESELIEIKNLESIIKKYPKGFSIVDKDKDNYYMVIPKEDSYILLDMKKLIELIKQFFDFYSLIDDNEQKDIVTKIINQIQKKLNGNTHK